MAFTQPWVSAGNAKHRCLIDELWTVCKPASFSCLHVCRHCSAQKNKLLCLGKVSDSRQQTARHQLRSDSLRSTNSASAAVMCSVSHCQRVTALLTDWLTDWLTEWPFNFLFFTLALFFFLWATFSLTGLRKHTRAVYTQTVLSNSRKRPLGLSHLIL